MNLQWSYWDWTWNWSLHIWPRSVPLMLLLEHRCLQETVVQQFPWKRKELERCVICEWGNKGQGMLDPGRGVVISPWIHLITLNLYIRNIKAEELCDSGSAKSPCFRQFMYLSWTSHLLWDHTDCRTLWIIFCRFKCTVTLAAGTLNAQCYLLAGLFFKLHFLKCGAKEDCCPKGACVQVKMLQAFKKGTH